MKKILLTLISIIFFYWAHCQNITTNNKIIPQPPDVASLFKFTEVPVSYFNGIANISVPLYEIKSGDLSFPVSINYHSSGIKVSEEAGVVGLGWSLSTVAAISETDPSANPGMLISSLPPLIAPDAFAVLPPNVPASAINVPMRGEVFKDINGNCDTYPPVSSSATVCEPDLFVMNANGISGKFFIPNGQTGTNSWVNLDASNIKLTGNLPSILCANCQGNLTAVLPDGTQYIFKDVAVTTINSFSASGATMNPIYSHSNYLSQIISPTGKTITFKYLNPSTVPITLSQQGFSEVWANDNCVNPAAAFTTGASITPSSGIQNMYVDTIYFDNGYCKYQYGSRLDMDGFLLNSINVYSNGQTAPVKVVAFQYAYYDYPKSNYGDFITDGQNVGPSFYNGPQESYRRLRLKLLSVQVNSDPPYTFAYNNTPLAYKTSFAQDLWGFFNGSVNRTLIPDYNNLGYLDNNVPASLLSLHPTGFILADRSAHPDFTKAGILTQINYPTGGYTTFQYQPNSFFLGGSNTVVTDTLVAVTDIGTGQQSLNFTVPVIPGQITNPAYLTVRLICGGGTGGCSAASGYSGGCTGYVASFPQNSLYVLLQMQDPSTGQWNTTQDNIFDFTNPAINNNGSSAPCGTSNLGRQLTPGNYRIIANYPDNLAQGAYVGPSAFISVNYKVQKTISYPNIGGGLRISNITDFSADGLQAFQRKVTYSPGKMMTTPIFYRYMSNGAIIAGASACPPDPSKQWIPGNAGSGNGVLQSDRSFLLLYNNPILPYSYSANGAPVGYDTAYEQKIDNNGNDQGRSVYVYASKPDAYFFYGTNLPGTPSTPYLDNGSLLAKIEQLHTGGQNYTTVHTVNYTYAIGTPQTFWAYKYDYMPRWRSDGTPEFDSRDPNSQYFHFYPIKTGHLNMTLKVDQTFASGTATTIATNYFYNSLNQQSKTITTQSNGKSYAAQTYYPTDYNANDFTLEMRNRNMLDYPIEYISQLNGLTTGGSYHKYYLHDNIVSPQQTYLFRTDAPVSSTPSAPSNIMDSHYQLDATYQYDALGNLEEQQKTNDVTEAYLYGYNSRYPVAKITNTNYATASGYVTQSLLNNPSNDVALRSALAPLRTIQGTQATIYTYKPLVGMTSQTGPDGNTVYYEYDGLNRLNLARDQYGNILKRYCYSYSGQLGACPASPTTQIPPPDILPLDSCYDQFWEGNGMPGLGGGFPDAKCVNGHLEIQTGHEHYTASVYDPTTGLYACTYHYEFSDGIHSWDVQKTSTTSCIPADSCSEANCSGEGVKCIDGVCTLGTRVNTSSYYYQAGTIAVDQNGNPLPGHGSGWYCTYHYEWADGSVSDDYAELNDEPCTIADDGSPHPIHPGGPPHP